MLSIPSIIDLIHKSWSRPRILGYGEKRGKTSEKRRKLFDKPNSCRFYCVYFNGLFLVVCILRLCAHNESGKRVYYKNDRFFSRFLCRKYDNVAMVFIQKRKTVFYWDFNVNIAICFSLKNQDNYGLYGMKV
jgi:hypothetical protein